MPQLSIVIVNYNVKYFIRQCIQSVFKSEFSETFEVIVVDNQSSDGSVDMLRQEFGQQIILIDNKENVGFSKANNQGFKIAQGKYVLILNPDTIVEENTLQVCYDYLLAHEKTAAIGVKMYDGAGNYLPESKRGFPKPLSALFKLTGISKLFPKSSVFNHYYLGHLDKEKKAEVEVLTGAFMFVRKDVLDTVEGFDEDYFMYGEDIELSYQIKSKGHEIVYLPTTSIIHFKGESTKKASLSYMKNFYGAMGIYAGKRNAGSGMLWNVILQFGILLTALVAIIKNVSSLLLRPIADVFLLFGSTSLAKKLWAKFYFNNPNYYSYESADLPVAILICILISIYYLFGQYDKRHNLKHLFYGFVFGGLTILSLYSLFPEELRFSRLVLLIMIATSPLLLFISRKIYNSIFYKTTAFDAVLQKRVAIVGHLNSCEQVSNIFQSHDSHSKLMGYVSDDNSSMTLGHTDEIVDVAESRGINELIFCSRDLTSQYIFNTIAHLGNEISFRIANNDNTSILGSDSKNRVGEWYTHDIAFKINQAFHIRTKRLLDIGVCFGILLLFPIILIFSKNRVALFKNWPAVILAKKTWIGYMKGDAQISELPVIKEGVFDCLTQSRSAKNNHHTNLFYARNYSIWLELEWILKTIF